MLAIDDKFYPRRNICGQGITPHVPPTYPRPFIAIPRVYYCRILQIKYKDGKCPIIYKCYRFLKFIFFNISAYLL